MPNKLSVTTIFKKIQEIPSVPFVTKPQIQYLTNYLESLEYKVQNNNYSLIIKSPKNPGRPKLIIMCHTDHPGLILKNEKEGILMGTVGVERLERILKEKNIRIKIFSPDGEYLGKGEIVSLNKSNKRKAYIKTKVKVLTNSLGQYDIDYFKENKNQVFTYNADNGISVATILSLLNENIKGGQFDVYFVFNLHEEVHQISSWHLAKNNVLGITNNDFIINLECLKIKNVDKKYSSANYEDGIVLQLSNTGCLFGYKSNKDNLAEKLVRFVGKKQKIKIQTGIIKDSCDSRPFSYFNLTPNIVTLTIPNRYKHNEDEAGNIVPEAIYKKDIENFYNLVKSIINSKFEINEIQPETSVTSKLKHNDNVTNKELMLQKANLNDRLDVAYKFIVKRCYFYPVNISDLVKDKISSILLYLTFAYQKLNQLIKPN